MTGTECPGGNSGGRDVSSSIEKLSGKPIRDSHSVSNDLLKLLSTSSSVPDIEWTTPPAVQAS